MYFISFLARIGNLLRKNGKFIAVCTITGFVVGVFYATLFFQPIYKSSAKLVVQPLKTDVLTGYKEIMQRNQNLVLTQMEVLRSEKLVRSVWKEVKVKNKLKIEDEEGIKRIKKAIYIQNPENTNIINITVSWENPLVAKEIANSTVSVYEKMTVDIAQRDVVKNIEAVSKKLKEAEKKLLNIRNDIKNFRKNHSLVDLRLEASNIDSQIQAFEQKKHEIEVAAAKEAGKISLISRNLGVQRLNSSPFVMTGSRDFSGKLETLQDELAGLSARYTDAHPAIVTVKSRIGRIEEQIQEQIKVSYKNLNENQALIEADAIKMVMAENLISSESRYTDLKTESKALNEVLVSLKQKKASIPQKQFTIVNYLQQEESWSNIMNNLQKKQVENEVIKAGMTANTGVVDYPLTPFNPTFPGKGQLVSMFMMFSALLASFFVVGRDVLNNNYENPEQIEKELEVPVLGVIPWLQREFYEEPDVMFAIEETASFYSLAYQRAVSGIRIKGYNSDKKVLAFTSAGFSKVRSTVIMNLAYGLNKTGQSVVVVDADFRTPSIGRELGIEISPKYNLAELLTVFSRDLRNNNEFDREKISLYARPVPNVENFFIIPNNGNVSDPGEFLYSGAFNRLIKSLRSSYDWVLVDTPPAMAVPDALIVGSFVDGMIVVTGLDVNRAVLRKIHKQFGAYGINIFGVVAREWPEMDASSNNTYIKQIFARMMPSREGVFIE